MTPYDYPEPLHDIERTINVWAQHKAETGADGVPEKMAEIKALLAEKLTELRALPEDAALRAAEPDDLAGIRALRPEGLRRYWTDLPEATYRDRLEGAWLGRCAGNGSARSSSSGRRKKWRIGPLIWAMSSRPSITGKKRSGPSSSNMRQARAIASPPPEWMACPPMTTSSTRSLDC